MKLHILIIFLALQLFNQNVIGQNNEIELDKHFEKKMRKAKVVGMQIGYISKNNTFWTQSYGKQDYRSNKIINDSTLFMIASCSKPVTALAILKLFNDGKLDLDTDINKYLPFNVTNPNYKKGFNNN